MTPDLACAQRLDAADPLRGFRDRFHIPVDDAGREVAYLVGNSLGLQPRAAAAAVTAELDTWASRGVNGHFEGARPWFSYHERCTAAAAHIVGARDSEVVMMGALTTNLHLLMVSFYRPTPSRYRILIEGGAFPSDRYAVASQARFHGLDPRDAIVELGPRPGEATLRDEDIEAEIARLGDSLALVMLSGVNYFTGQAFDVRRVTAAAHAVGAIAGFDLAHAAGNIPLQLHDDDVDFAAWCSYKYLNSGPGGVGGVFVHERHGADATLPRFAGWWGNDPASRFEMPEEFVPARGAAGWQTSNAPILPMATFVASGELFLEATIPALRAKSELLSEYLTCRLDALGAEMITPRETRRRGAQVSLRVRRGADRVRDQMEAAGVVCDFRRPDVVRVAPTPLYNRFEDIHRLAVALEECAS
ncbi:MAG: kynureninase [Myxococcales bacterium]|nr:kynureninase [Myxococcales bacterium]MCB9533232.1 kynureninase [Myxococcales bacterium]